MEWHRTGIKSFQYGKVKESSMVMGKGLLKAWCKIFCFRLKPICILWWRKQSLICLHHGLTLLRAHLLQWRFLNHENRQGLQSLSLLFHLCHCLHLKNYKYLVYLKAVNYLIRIWNVGNFQIFADLRLLDLQIKSTPVKGVVWIFVCISVFHWFAGKQKQVLRRASLISISDRLKILSLHSLWSCYYCISDIMNTLACNLYKAFQIQSRVPKNQCHEYVPVFD